VGGAAGRWHPDAARGRALHPWVPVHAPCHRLWHVGGHRRRQSAVASEAGAWRMGLLWRVRERLCTCRGRARSCGGRASLALLAACSAPRHPVHHTGRLHRLRACAAARAGAASCAAAAACMGRACRQILGALPRLPGAAIGLAGHWRIPAAQHQVTWLLIRMAARTSRRLPHCWPSADRAACCDACARFGLLVGVYRPAERVQGLRRTRGAGGETKERREEQIPAAVQCWRSRANCMTMTGAVVQRRSTQRLPAVHAWEAGVP